MGEGATFILRYLARDPKFLAVYKFEQIKFTREREKHIYLYTYSPRLSICSG